MENCLEKALALNPDNADANHLLALMYMETADYIKAARIFHGLISRYPGEKEYCLGLRRCFEHLDDPETLKAIDERLRDYDDAAAPETGNNICADDEFVDVASRDSDTKIDTSVRIEDDCHRLSEVSDENSEENHQSWQPLVSVIVSTYNNEDYLKGCLDDL